MEFLSNAFPSAYIEPRSAVGVAQDEDPLPLVRCADFTRREYSPRRLITDLFQFSNDFAESKADVSFDIFKEAHFWSENPNSVCDPRPQVSWVFLSCSLSCCGEWLAGITSSKDVHSVSKAFPREGFKIRPYRC
jgi:hypothetical protein